jgi:rare lipoprotein A (peptidoglycan hydrolase)
MKGTNRIIDLSKAAAKELNMLGAGLVKVKVEVLI